MPKLPIKIKPGALPVATEEVTKGVLDKLPQVDRREFLRGALSTLANTSALGKVADVVAPVAKSATKAVAKQSIPAFFTKFTDDMEEVFSNASVQRQLDDADGFYDDIDIDDINIDDISAMSDDINMGQIETWMYLKIPEEDLPFLEYFEHGGDDIVDAIDDIVKKNKITKDDLANYLEENNLAPSSQDLKDYGLEKYDDLLKYKEHRDLTELE